MARHLVTADSDHELRVQTVYFDSRTDLAFDTARAVEDYEVAATMIDITSPVKGGKVAVTTITLSPEQVDYLAQWLDKVQASRVQDDEERS